MTHETEVHVIDCPPPPEGYARMLLLIYKNGTNPTDTHWAESEIIHAFKVASRFNPNKWGKP